jgi:hypothetical protein
MEVYYIDSYESKKYIMENVALKSDKSSKQLRSDMLAITNFCRDEGSITTQELSTYLDNGITVYALNNGILSGVIVFDVNINVVNIKGLCTPSPSVGVGTLLMNTVKTFAELNKMNKIKLTCYGSVVDFYMKNGFRIQNQSQISYDSDYDSEDEGEQVTRYDMEYNVISGGKRKTRKTRKTRKNKKHKKGKKSKKHRY